MSVTAFRSSRPEDQGEVLEPAGTRNPDWLGAATGGAFLAGALLLITGKKRAGLVVTTAATAITLLEQQETIREWWNRLPQYLDHADRLLEHAGRILNDIEATRERVRGMLNR